MSENQNLTRAIADDFKSVSGPELKAFANQLGVDYHPNIGDEKLRARMLHKLGREVVEIPGDDEFEQVSGPVPGGPEGIPIKELMALNLTPDGIWQGRRRIVSIVRPDIYKGTQPHPFRWGRHLCMIPYNRPVSVPYPIYHIMRRSEFKEVEQVRTQGRDGTPKIVNHFTTVNRWRYTDMGDDPKTAHLPVSQKQQFRQVAEATDLFKGWNRRELTRLARRLTNIRYPKGGDAEEIRDAILQKLGYDVDLLEMDAESLTA